jgi:hypothetical protein
MGPTDLPALLQALQIVANDLNTLLNPAAALQGALDTARQTLTTIFQNLLLGTGDAESVAHRFTESRTILHFEPFAQAIADMGLVATVGYGCFRIMWAATSQNLYSIRVLLPRLLLGVILINFALPLLQGAIDVNNALCQVVLSGWGHLEWSRLFSTFDFITAPGLTLVVLAALLLGYVLLAFVYVVRYALLVILAITAPLAALAFVLPDTHQYAKLWGSLFVTSLFMQPLQLLILEVGFGLETESSLPIRHAFALAALWLTFKVPGALHMSSSVGRHSFTAVKKHLSHGAHALVKAAA